MSTTTTDRNPTTGTTGTTGTTPGSERSLSVTARPTGGSLGLLGAQILAELKQNARVPEYAIGVLGVPIILYAMFGLSTFGQRMPAGTDVGTMLVASFAAYGVVSLAIFTFGVDVAAERGKGWLRRLRSTPMPMSAYFIAKITTALVFTVLIVAGIALVAMVGKADMDWSRLLRTTLVLMGGTVAFSAMGFALAFWARPKAASAVGNLMFLPLSFVSGFFQPLSSLPQFLQDAAPWLPTYHFGRLVWSQIAPAADVADLTGRPVDSLTGHVAWVLGTFLAFGALSIAGYLRDGRREKA